MNIPTNQHNVILIQWAAEVKFQKATSHFYKCPQIQIQGDYNFVTIAQTDQSPLLYKEH